MTSLKRIYGKRAFLTWLAQQRKEIYPLDDELFGRFSGGSLQSESHGAEQAGGVDHGFPKPASGPTDGGRGKRATARP